MNDTIEFLGVNNCKEMIGHQMCSTSELCIITTYPVYDICIYVIVIWTVIIWHQHV